jgi:hypothetical protein
MGRHPELSKVESVAGGGQVGSEYWQSQSWEKALACVDFSQPSL